MDSPFAPLMAEIRDHNEKVFKEFIESESGELCLNPNTPIDVIIKTAFSEGRISRMHEESQ